WTVGYLTDVGQDAVSDRMVGFMAAQGIDTSRIGRRADRTVGLYLIELKGAERSFSYWRDRSAARLLADDAARLDAALAGVRLAYVSGITLAVLEGAGQANLLAALGRARAAGTVVAFDPNLRPRLWTDGDTMRAAVMAGAAQADIVLPSHEDEAAHFGDADPAATAARYAAAGARTVVVKDGAGEVLCLSGGAVTRHRPAPVVRVVDTTAAGDSFNAGFLARWLAGASAAEAMVAGSAIAAQVIGARGALVAVTPG
ncbi:MAG TPA: PfkB family carbohydrate kinase, partial [Paracoccaceae bacterium]|nr:PfkB family carbohydrate kinase [Paracoccaceae bacterium]